ncbi:hypothetical protein CAPTEDRAFT_83835, partial [Capitella teleta]
VDGTWMDWTDWSTCSASCGAGIKHRKRTCDGQSGNGRKCPGNDLHNDFCVEAECPAECVPDVDGTWMDWTGWSTCSASCGAGIKHRKRTCDGQSGNGRKCPGNDLHNDFCVEAECPA